MHYAETSSNENLPGLKKPEPWKILFSFPEGWDKVNWAELPGCMGSGKRKFGIEKEFYKPGTVTDRGLTAAVYFGKAARNGKRNRPKPGKGERAKLPWEIIWTVR